MQSLDRYLASNVCCRKENSFQDRHCSLLDHDASANNSNGTKSDIVETFKKGNIFWKIPMKIPVNRHYYSLATENVDSMCQSKTAGRGVLVTWGEGVDHPPDQTGGKSASSSLGGIDAPGCAIGLLHSELRRRAASRRALPRTSSFCLWTKVHDVAWKSLVRIFSLAPKLSGSDAALQAKF